MDDIVVFVDFIVFGCWEVVVFFCVFVIFFIVVGIVGVGGSNEVFIIGIIIVVVFF